MKKNQKKDHPNIHPVLPVGADFWKMITHNPLWIGFDVEIWHISSTKFQHPDSRFLYPWVLSCGAHAHTTLPQRANLRALPMLSERGLYTVGNVVEPIYDRSPSY